MHRYSALLLGAIVFQKSLECEGKGASGIYVVNSSSKSYLPPSISTATLSSMEADLHCISVAGSLEGKST